MHVKNPFAVRHRKEPVGLAATQAKFSNEKSYPQKEYEAGCFKTMAWRDIIDRINPEHQITRSLETHGHLHDLAKHMMMMKLYTQYV